jgi:hypothetical protein
MFFLAGTEAGEKILKLEPRRRLGLARKTKKLLFRFCDYRCEPTEEIFKNNQVLTIVLTKFLTKYVKCGQLQGCLGKAFQFR